MGIFFLFINSFFLKLIQEPVLLRLLYHEAKDNVLDDRYIFKSEEEYAELAGIQAFLAYRSFNESLHTPSFYRLVSSITATLLPGINIAFCHN